MNSLNFLKCRLYTSLIVVFIVLLCSPAASAQTKYQDWCQQGGGTVATSGIISTTFVQRSFKTCTITVKLTGTSTLATLYADDAGTPLANPFTNQNTSTGQYYFYVIPGAYDITFAGSGLTTFTLGSVDIGSTTLDCSKFAGANAGAKIAACMNSLPSTGGVADARLFAGAQTISQDMFSGVNKPIQLILGVTTYTVSVGQGIGTNNIRVTGAGRASILRASAGTFNILTISGNDCVLDNFSIEGGATSDGTTQFGIFTGSGSPALRGVVRNMFFGGASSVVGVNNGIKLDDGNLNWDIHDNTFRYMIGGISGTGYGVLLGAANFARVHNNIFLGTAGGGLDRGRHAIYMSSGLSYSDISDNLIDGMNSSSISIYATALQTAVAYNLVHHNSITGEQLSTDGSAGIELSANVHDNWIDDNDVISPARTGIILNDLSSGGLNTSNHVRNNHVYSAGYSGIECRGCKYAEIAGNSVFDSSSASIGTYDGIIVAAVGGVEPANQVRVFGNFVRSSTPTYRNAIEINVTAPSVANTQIVNNVVVAGTVGAITLNGATAVVFGNSTGGTSELWNRPVNFTGNAGFGASASIAEPLAVMGRAVFSSASNSRNVVLTRSGSTGEFYLGATASSNPDLVLTNNNGTPIATVDGANSSAAGSPTFLVTGAHIQTSGGNTDISGVVTLNGGGSATYSFTRAWAFAPAVVTGNQSNANPVKAVATTTAITFTGTAGDVISYVVVGMPN